MGVSMLCLVILAGVTLVSGQSQPTVTTKYGKIQGFFVDSVAIYYGIPFAKPPVGDLR
jgi:hypothetical protein